MLKVQECSCAGSQKIAPGPANCHLSLPEVVKQNWRGVLVFLRMLLYRNRRNLCTRLASAPTCLPRVYRGVSDVSG